MKAIINQIYRLNLKSNETILVDTLNDCKINRFIIMDDNIYFGDNVRNIDTLELTNTIMHNQYFPYHNGYFFNLNDSDDKLTLEIWSDINKLYDDNAKVHLKLKSTDIKASDSYIVPLDSGIYLIHKERINSQNNEELHTIYEINESGDLAYVGEFNENNNLEMFIVNDKFATLLDNRSILDIRIIN